MESPEMFVKRLFEKICKKSSFGNAQVNLARLERHWPRAKNRSTALEACCTVAEPRPKPLDVVLARSKSRPEQLHRSCPDGAASM
jgi:hypothetical protein